jgi:hypothetical protein
MGGVGPAILADGSNVNPIALTLLQMRTADGGFLLPTPQTINSSAPFAVQGSSTSSCRRPSTKTSSCSTSTLCTRPIADLRAGCSSRRVNRSGVPRGQRTPGFPLTTDDKYVASSVSHSWVLDSGLFNEARFGYGVLETDRTQTGAFTFSQIGITSSSQNNDSPIIGIGGSFNLASSPIGPDATHVHHRIHCGSVANTAFSLAAALPV